MGMYMYSQNWLNIHTKAPYGSLVPRCLEKLEKHPLSNIRVYTGELENYCLLSKNLEGIYTSSGVVFKEWSSKKHYFDWGSNMYRATALTSQNHVIKYFRKAKQHGVQWQLKKLPSHLYSRLCSCSV